MDMRLTDDDLKLFFKLHPGYLVFGNKKLNIVPGVDTKEAFMDLPFHEKCEIRNAVLNQPELLNSFAEKNPEGFNDVELAIVKSWQYALDGSFYVMRYGSENTLLLDTGTTPKVYGVTGLNMDLIDLLGDTLPVYVKTVLLPFKHQIVYDGFIFTYPITFENMVEQELYADMENWINRHGVITQLPFIGDTESVEEKLRYYLRTHWNRDVYTEEISHIVRHNKHVEKLYYELTGKLDAKDARTYFKELGIQDVWCAVLNGRILATGKSREAVVETLDALLPRDRKLYPFIFHFKG
ncbi:MAG: hypothetical protein WBM02_06235 [bacterium]